AEADVRQPQISHTEQQQHTPNEMMDVDVPDDDVSERTCVAMNRVRDATKNSKRDKKANEATNRRSRAASAKWNAHSVWMRVGGTPIRIIQPAIGTSIANNQAMGGAGGIIE